MTEDDDPFPNWNLPATKGDVIRSMIWTRSLVRSVYGIIVAQKSGDIEEFRKAFAAFEKENDEFTETLDSISGRIR